MWKTMPHQQQRGAQFGKRPGDGARRTELEGDERGEDAESDAARRERAMERDTRELNEELARRERERRS